MSNIIFHPLIRIAFRLWEDSRDQKINWRTDNSWRNVVTAMATTNANGVNVMDKKNTDWQGKILVANYDVNGKETWSLSSTRQTRDSAYQYLCQVANLPPASASKGGKSTAVA